MYYIVSYDIDSKRCPKVMKILRKFLFHTHNSVFEGELTNKEFKLLTEEINKIINKETDSIIYYKISSIKAISKEGINYKSENIIII